MSKSIKKYHPCHPVEVSEIALPQSTDDMAACTSLCGFLGIMVPSVDKMDCARVKGTSMWQN